ncbi:MAG TPA: hypothetical protein VIY49_34030 [Bryobacteraceae bacterium]
MASSLLAKLKKVVLDWQKQQTTMPMVRTTIQDVLEDGLPRA